MKNVITIVLDAFCYNNLEKKIGSEEVTPFLNKLGRDGISYKKMYSYAPYTEAALISLLGEERTLEEGGYLFGNANIRKSMLSYYKDVGYHTILGYSPYVCSKSYLKGVTEYKYTRLFSIQPCFNYRFKYFKEKKSRGLFQELYYDACIEILEEAFDTWITQCDSLINKLPQAEMICLFVKDMNIVVDVKMSLLEQLQLFKNNKKKYIDNIFLQWESHKLFELSIIYNERKEHIKVKNYLKAQYNSRLKDYQKKYEECVLNKLKIDIRYIFNMFINNKNKKDFLRTIKNYYRFKKNKNLENYLNFEMKSEMSLHIMCNSFINEIKKYDDKDENYYLYFQPQDFHLPSLFHSFDIDDLSVLQNEFDIAFTLLDKLDNSYKGNIIADLSARFCDFKLEYFYNTLKKELKNDFIFVVTADHGYPSYYSPPRPIIYNQTYTEAFHVPFVINVNQRIEDETGLYSILDGLEVIKQLAGIKEQSFVKKRNYILCEYAGPGCPMINEKKIWYTLITDELKLSAEVYLGEKAVVNDVIDVYDIKNDLYQKINLRLSYTRDNKIQNLIEIVSDRSLNLFRKNKYPSYLKRMLDNINYDK